MGIVSALPCMRAGVCASICWCVDFFLLSCVFLCLKFVYVIKIELNVCSARTMRGERENRVLL